MSNPIAKIADRLKKYPEAEYEVRAKSITVKPCSKSGFPVSFYHNQDGSFTIAFYFWHEEFKDENEALNCFAFGLSTACRLRVTKKGNRSIKWTVESYENGIWQKDSTTGRFNLTFWKKPKYEFLQNDLIRDKG